MSHRDPLYQLFEQHLYNCLFDEETSDQFVYRVVADYLEHILKTASIPIKVSEFVENDLRDEVREMLLKKTYGHFSLAEFRRVQQDKAPSKELRRQS
jgi:hypothetical protein